jgi:hypothetical protein
MPSSTGPSLRARSAGDLHCPAETLKIYRLDSLSYRVLGCGQDTVYLAVCDLPEGYPKRKCTWSMDSSRGIAKSPHNLDAVSPAAPASGCSYDAQCKGDRICVSGQCVAPPPAATAGPAAPAPAP